MNKFILSFILGLSLTFFSPLPTKATVLFFDDFETDSLSKWEIINGSWDIQEILSSNWAHTYVPIQSDSEIQTGNFTWSDYEFHLNIYKHYAPDVNVFFRVQPFRTEIFSGHDIPQAYSIHITSTIVELQKATSTEFKTVDSGYAGFGGDINGEFIIKVTGNLINIYYQTKDNLIISYQDNDNPYMNGRIALGSITGSSSANVYFDNITVTSIEPASTGLSLPNLKQYSNPWGPLEYDSASDWADDPEITRWGCALTSAAMILQYYNHDTDPEKLNDWLLNQPDGYIGKGLVNWNTISRFSLINTQKLDENKNLTALEMKYNPFSTTLVDSELELDQPLIAKVPGHFFGVKGKDDSEYLINDPASEFRTTLSQVETAYASPTKSLITYTPTETDLSYIILTSPNQNPFKVFNQDDSEIFDGYFSEEMLWDDTTLTPGGNEVINSFYLSKPINGIYKVIMNTNDEYLLNYYFYDNLGEVSMGKIDGENTGTETTFIINYKDGVGSIYQANFSSLVELLYTLKEENRIGAGYYNFATNLISLILKFEVQEKYLLTDTLLSLLSNQTLNFTSKQIYSENDRQLLLSIINSL